MSGSRFISLLGSWWLTAGLLLALWAVYLVLSFGRNPYPAWISFIFHTPGGIAVFSGLVINLAAASIRIVFTRTRRPDLSPGAIRSMDVHAELPIRDGQALRHALELLPGGAADIPAQGMRRITGRFSFLPGTIFRSGLIVMLIGLMVTAHGRKTYDTMLRDGERKDILGTTVMLAGIDVDLPADYLVVGDDGTFLLESVSARVKTGDATSVITPGFPARINGLWYRIRHLHYTQAIMVELRGSRHRLVADLDVLPPGRSSIVSLPSGKGFLVFALDPDRTITKGLVTGRQYDLARPAYRVAAQEGTPREQVSGKRMRPGERAVLGPAMVELGAQGLALGIQIVSDPGLPLLYAGVIVLLTGLCAMISRFFWYEQEIAWMARDGVLLIGSRDEFFKKWGVHRFQRWQERLVRTP